MSWLDEHRYVRVEDVAHGLGFAVRHTLSSATMPCPACRVERRHEKRRDPRGAVGVRLSAPTYWHCFSCGARGDGPDFVGHALCGGRYRDLRSDQRNAVHAWFDGRTTIATSAVHTFSPRPPIYPPVAEVARLIEAAGRVDLDQQTAEYLRWRALDAASVAQNDLARALGRDHGLPDWARLGARTWLETGHRLLAPLFDARGYLRSVLARSVERAPMLKSAAPRGFERSGLVLANEAGRAMLEQCVADDVIVLREGEIDFWSTATDYAGPVIGVFSGSWTTAHAQRVPDGARIIIATDADAAGDKYAADIAATFKGRQVRLKRERRAA